MEAPARQTVEIPPSQPIESLELPPGCTSWGTDRKKAAELGARMERAASSGTPSTVAEALSPRALNVGGHEIHRFTIQTYLNLQKLASPFIDRKEGDVVIPTVQQIVTSLWAMAVPDTAVRRAIALGGERLEDEIAGFAATISMEDLAETSAVISLRISKGFEPAAKMNPPPSQEGGDSPLDATSSATGPAGC